MIRSWLKALPGPWRRATLHARLQQLPPLPALDQISLQQDRWVVVDVETSGLSLQKDQVIAIGAVVIEAGAIQLGQQFERVLLRQGHDLQRQLGDSLFVHGLTPEALAAGEDPAEVLLQFAEFVRDAPLLAFHAPFDQRMLEKAYRQDLKCQHRITAWDVAEIARWLVPEAKLDRAGLDDWLQYFHLQVSERHNASADALVTAELMLPLLRLLRRRGIENLAQLDQALAVARKLQQART